MIRLFNRLFGSRPLAAHCPGPKHREWDHFVRVCDATTPNHALGECAEITVITWDSRRHLQGLGPMERSLQRFGVAPRILGQGASDWTNYQKLALTAQELQQIQTPYVLGLDADDVVLLDHPRELLQRFKTHFTCDLLFNSTGSWCWPVLPDFIEFESSRPLARLAQGRHWFNSGMFIGRTDFCRNYFQHASQCAPLEKFETSDQAILKKIWPHWYPRVQLDYACTIFQWFNEDRRHLVVDHELCPRQVQLLKLLKPLGHSLRGVEVGVFDGLTSVALLHHLPGLELWMVDSWVPFRGDCALDRLDYAAFEYARERAEWWTKSFEDRRFILATSSIPASDRFSEASLDFAFIDANHIYEAVAQDIRAWWPKVRRGGLLIGHDYGVYGDAEGRWGVKQAADEFANSLGQTVQVGLDGVWWLEKP